MPVSEKMINHFNAPRITLQGSKLLWGRRFKRTYDLRIESEAVKAEEAYNRLSQQAADWKRGREVFEKEGFCSIGAWYSANVQHFENACQDPCT